jgi:uncharacterized protein (DUF608 family)
MGEWDIGRVVRNQRWRSGVPLGGLGVGKFDLLTDGAFGNFTINHNWDRPTGVVRGTFFALRAGDETTLLRLRRPGEYDAPELRNIEQVEYKGLFPRALLRFGGLPVAVELEAFAPLIPQNTDDSCLPIALFTLRLKATERRTISVLFSWENLLGWGGRQDVAWDDRRGNTHTPESLVCGGQTWSGLRFRTSADQLPLVRGEYLVLGDGPTRAEPHWDPLAGLLARDVTLEPGVEQAVRFAAVWFLPQHPVVFDKRRKRTGEFVTVDAGAAIDGRPDTKFATEPPTAPGEMLVLDLGASPPTPVDALTVRTTWPQGDFTSGFALACSADGQAWTAAPHTREPVRSGTAQFAFAPQAARYWRITQRGYGPDWRWEVAEAFASAAGVRLDFAGATAQVHPDELVRSEEDLGHYYLNRFSDPLAIAQYALEHWDRLYAQTREWHDLVLAATLPDWLKDLLLNHAYPVFANALLTRDGRFSVLESPDHMRGALGTMDQRMASHALWLMLFPDLDRRELELYADCQERVEPVADGRIPHFCGNFHHAVGDPMVEYGSTDWPDLSCSWVMQVLKHARWTGDRGLIERTWPHVQRAMAWLAAQDTDGDLIPEGGSTYDYEALPRGAYIFTASVYLGALRAADEFARLRGADAHHAALFERVQQKTLERLYDDERGVFIKWRAGAVDDVLVPNTFIAPLAGDWLMRLTGLDPIFPPEICESTLRETLARHVKSFWPIPPMEVTPDGRPHTNVCFVLQHEPYVGCEAIYLGYVDDGLDTLKRIYDAAWDLNWSPWDCPLNMEAPHGRQSWLVTYMTGTATWHVLPALAGTTIDLLGGELHFQPRAAYHGPLFFPTFWAWLDCEPGVAQMRVLKVFKPGAFARVNGVERQLAIRAGEVWELSEFAQLPRPRTVAARFRQPPRQIKPWTIRSIRDCDGDLPPLHWNGALDDDPHTRWTTDRPMRPGDWLALDLGQAAPLRGVRMRHDGSPDQYPRGLRVELSAAARWDDAAWQTVAELSVAQVQAALRDGWLAAPFPETAARHIRLTNLGAHDLTWWSIYELQVDGAPA